MARSRKLLGQPRQLYNARYFGLPEGNIGEAALCVAVLSQAAVDLLRGYDAARWLEGDDKSEGFGISFETACQVAKVEVDLFKSRVLKILETEDYAPEWDRLADTPIGALRAVQTKYEKVKE